MARQELGPAMLAVATAVRDRLVPYLSQPLHPGRPDLPTAVVVGVSGGADSLALAAGVQWCCERGYLQTPCRAVVVDHQLQPGSDQVAKAAAAAVTGVGMATDIADVEVSDSGTGPEAAARAARYRALLSDRSALVVVGHTLDDQAETVLLGLARGSGTRSLAGMAERSGRLIRPLLGLRRDQTEAACVERGLVWWVDPHNSDLRYQRVRARQLLPRLEADLGPGVTDALARTAAMAREDADLLDAMAARLMSDAVVNGVVIVDQIAAAPPALRSRVLHRWLRGQGATDLSAGHVASVGGLLDHWHGQRGVDVPGGTVVRSAGQICFQARA